MGNEKIIINNEFYDPCRLKMVEIYGGKDPKWKGWHNLLLLLSDEPADHKAIAGPIDPETSTQLKVAIKALSK